MADNELVVVVYGGIAKTTRSKELNNGGAGGIHGQVTLVVQGPEAPPDLTGSTDVQAVTSSSAVALDPPTNGADQCWIRIWHPSQDSTKRLFYRRDGAAPSNDGSFCEGFLLHGEGKMVRLDDFTDFLVIAENGETFTMFEEWSET